MDWQDIARWMIDLINRFGQSGIFVMMFLENLGIPLPTELAFVAGQTMIVSGRASYASVFLVSLVGKTAGSILTYFIGRYFADKIKHIHVKFSRLKRSQEIFARWMKKYGDLAVFISRLVGYVRPWASYLAGIGEVRFIPFMIYNIAGSAIIIALSMATLGVVVELWRSYGFLRPYLAVALFFSFVGFWIYIMLYSKYKEKKK
ncbi:MAG: DedA family protein [Candidatus Subteraquimicrobiales bacterium]|nr:DedA family protein [Candidatus Subteraquimicrobiales bacterium]